MVTDTDVPSKPAENVCAISVKRAYDQLTSVCDTLVAVREAVLADYATLLVSILVDEYNTSPRTRPFTESLVHRTKPYDAFPAEEDRADKRVRRMCELLGLTYKDTDAVAVHLTKALRRAGAISIEARQVYRTTMIRFVYS